MRPVFCTPGPRRSPGASAGESVVEEVEHLLEGGLGGLTRLVDQVLGEHRVGDRGVTPGVALRGVDLDADEVVAEQPLEGSEPVPGR